MASGRCAPRSTPCSRRCRIVACALRCLARSCERSIACRGSSNACSAAWATSRRDDDLSTEAAAAARSTAASRRITFPARGRLRPRNAAMFATFFTELKQAGVPVTLREYLTLMEAMDKDLAGRRIEEFYYLSRATLVKDERNLDRFDRVFGHVFKGLDYISDALTAEIPTEWLKKLTEKHLTGEEKKLIEALGGLDKLLETLRMLAEQKTRHQGGKKWIGTAGTSPFGAYGYNPEGVRIGQDGNRNFRAV